MPLAETYGIITPSSLHYERHHSGVPAIDPARHRLVIHGMVQRPLVLTMDEIRRLPSVSRIHFLDSGGEWGASTPKRVDALLPSCDIAANDLGLGVVRPCCLERNVARCAMQLHSVHSSALWCRKIGMWLTPIC
jgi:hypothetical protein